MQGFLRPLSFFFGVPALFLLSRDIGYFRKAAIGAGILGILLFSFDFVAEFNNAWGWGIDFIIPYIFWDTVSADIMVWYFLWVFLIILFYEHFLEHDRSRRISRHAVPVAIAGVGIAAVIVATYLYAPHLLVVPYAYAVLSFLISLVCVVELYRRPHLGRKVVKLIPFFALFFMAYEIIALYTGLWTFPGTYVGSVAVGNLMFPLEELVVWILMSSAMAALYYEFTIGDER
ncbi:hypothetical protein A3A38_00710 [Candidatus Kaiserbacteria bacterium RIFCSPLOWO2_01_FULL_53_17]|uniref:Lycopene cyclase domain-containing protein n=1 Tax=Candidatus Kaiserbacteria bacterium RIFCSPLOWO2_01_FULL_53_17 TaxID=1798511 RepID=A0A1F6EGD2_9BACT|nr:MAG: hypothetical protein A3A38_00710 [Candidatus Kaiserbacteria bacterium RIFCSPLOWO2_01_FULL_53_17]